MRYRIVLLCVAVILNSGHVEYIVGRAEGRERMGREMIFFSIAGRFDVSFGNCEVRVCTTVNQ